MKSLPLLLLSVVFLLGPSMVMGASSQDVAAYEWTKVFDGQDTYWARRAGLQVVELRNESDAALDMGDDPYWLHFSPSSWRFPSGTSIPSLPSTTTTIAVSWTARPCTGSGVPI